MIGLRSPNHFLLIRRPVRGEQEGTGRENAGRTPPAEQGDGGPGPAGGPGKEQGRDRVKDEGLTFCLCYVPENSPIKPTMANLVLMAGRRWGAEEAMSTGKGPVGWDENQFRKWESLQHHTALAGMAMLKANIIRKRVNELSAAAEARVPHQGNPRDMAPGIAFPGAPEPGSNFSPDDLMIPLGDSAVPRQAHQEIPGEIGFIQLSVNEILRLKSIVRGGMSTARIAFHVRWSKWRRRHQAIARWYRWIARMKAELGAASHSGLESAVTLRDHCI